MQNSGSPTNSLPVPEGFGKSGIRRTITNRDMLTFRSALLRAIDWEESLKDAWGVGTPEWKESAQLAAHFRATRDRLFPEHRDTGKLDGEAITIQELSRRHEAALRSRVLPKDDAVGTQAYQEKRGQESKP